MLTGGDLRLPTIVHVAGRCGGLPERIGGWAAVVEGAHPLVTAQGGARDTTHIRMLISAVTAALELARLNGRLVIKTNATYVITGVNLWLPKWRRAGGIGKPVANADLWHDVVVAATEMDVAAMKVSRPTYFDDRAWEIAGEEMENRQAESSMFAWWEARR